MERNTTSGFFAFSFIYHFFLLLYYLPVTNGMENYDYKSSKLSSTVEELKLLND